MAPKKVLVTGVYGLIGSVVYEHLQRTPDRYEVYGLARRRHASARVPEGHVITVPEDRFILSDLSNLDQVTQALSGMEVVVHMAADPSEEAGWESLLASNIIGAYHVFEGCRRADVKRIIYASTTMVSFGYRTETPYSLIAEGRFDELPAEIPIVTHEWPVRPNTLYACTKLWGEALARSYAEAHGLSCICLRIGWVRGEDRPAGPHSGDIWCSQRDIVQLVECCINAPEELRFDIFYGMSDNRWRWVDIEHARQVVGYEPQDRAEDWL